MNYLDIIILIVVCVFVIQGIRKGFVTTCAAIIGFITALVLATGNMGKIALYLNTGIGLSKGAGYIIGFLVIFFGVLLVFKLAAMLLVKLFTLTSTRWLDRIGGGILGFFIGMLLSSVALAMLSYFSFTDRFLPEMENSLLYPYVREFYPKVYNSVIRLKSSPHTYQAVSEEILKGQPEETLRKTQAGRRFLELLGHPKQNTQNQIKKS